MKHPYAYRVFIEKVPTPRDHTLLADELDRVLRNLPRTLDSSPDGQGWEVNSHNLLPMRDGLLLSIILRRSRT